MKWAWLDWGQPKPNKLKIIKHTVGSTIPDVEKIMTIRDDATD